MNIEINQTMLNEWLISNEVTKANTIYLKQPRQGEWYEYTWAMVVQQARQVAQFLIDQGLKKGDRIAIFSKNCAEWFITDFGISLAGMVSVPLFANQHRESIEFVLKHAEVKLVFIGKLDQVKRTRSYLPALPTVSFGYHEEINDCIAWETVLKTEPLLKATPVTTDDIFTIIYSSGTSGLPKGAVYTHGIIAAYLDLYPKDIARIRQVDGYHLVSYLPLAHVYERTAIELGSVTLDCDVSFIENLDKFVDNLKYIQPTFFTAVPRIWGVFQQKIEQKVSLRKLNWLLKIPLVSQFIKKKIRTELGLQHCLNCFSGASHLPIGIIEFFDRLGIYIQEGYGQTENLAYATFSLLENRCPGFVGTPRLEVEIRLNAQEELEIRSPCLMKEYYSDPEASYRVLSQDGWLSTGDIAEIDGHHRVRIIARISENFKNQKGEFVTPAPIEAAFSDLSIIDQLCLIGRELPNNVLILSLTQEARHRDKAWIKNCLLKKLHQVNSQLASFEKISHIVITKMVWSIENGFLTPTLKVKRRNVEKSYLAMAQQVIEERQLIVWEK